MIRICRTDKFVIRCIHQIPDFFNLTRHVIYKFPVSYTHLVVLSVVNGKIVMKDRKLVNVDEMEYMSKMNDCPDDIGKRAADEFLSLIHIWAITATTLSAK